MAQILQKSKVNTNRIKITNKENEDNLVKDVTALISEVNALSDGTVETTNLELTGSLSVPDGLVSALPIRFGADENNGFYGVSDTQLGVAVEGVLTALFDATGEKTGSVGELVTNAGIDIVGHLNSPSAKGVRYTGTITNSGTTTVVLATMVGMASFTTIPDIAAGATQNIVITNTLVTDDTVGMIVMQTNTAANGSIPRIKTIVYSLNTITITLVNSAAATATGGFACDVSFQLFQLA